MRKALPMSALITGLLAAPGMGVAAPVQAATALVAGQAGAFPAVMPAEVAIQWRRLARGEKPDAYGMQDLQKRFAAEVQQHLAQAVQRREQLYPAQLIMPPAALQPRMEKAAFLGVATSPAPVIVREQLNLPRGVGLVVDFVEKDSPAEAAGIKVNDVLQKLDDQLLINGQQLAVLVRTKKPGDTVKLTVIHAAKAQEVPVKLVEKEVAALEDLADPSAGGNAGGTAIKTSTANRKDDTHDITLRSDNGDRHVTVKEIAGGKVIFDGPINTDEQMKTLPAGVREKVQTMLEKIK